MNMKQLRDANVARCKVWHPGPQGINSWSLSDWGIATAGELGEALNIIKKLNRVRDNLVGNAAHVTAQELYTLLADELADTLIYLDLLAAAAGIDLESATRRKFNRTSDKVGIAIKL